MKRGVFGILLWACFVLMANAQEMAVDSTNSPSKAAIFFSNIRERVDAIIDKFQSNSTDSSYVYKPKEPWRVQLYLDLYGHDISFQQATNHYALTSLCKTSLGISAAYRGLSLSVSLDPLKLHKKRSNIEYNINYYGSFFGVDLQFSHTKSFRERYESFKMYTTDAHLRNISLNGFYVFNHKRFSYGAVFDQSTIQKRSAGSPLISVTGYVNSSRMDDLSEVPLMRRLPLNRLRMAFAAIGAGYAYNFVPKGDHWLVHLSMEPSMTVWKRTYAYLENGTQIASVRPYNFYMTGRVGSTYFLDNFFVGFNGIVQLYEAGKINNINILHTKFKGGLFAGVRF